MTMFESVSDAATADASALANLRFPDGSWKDRCVQWQQVQARPGNDQDVPAAVDEFFDRRP